jgi:8-amino-7-oxononanoate synthase
MLDLPDWMNESLVDRQQANLIRKSVVLDGPQTPYTAINGESYIAFCSNDYLGLANHPVLKQSMQNAVDEYGVGSGASHLVVGHTSAHQKLEEDIAQWLGYERVMLFSTGYMANLGAVTALGHKTRDVIGDKLNHASLVDGAKLSDSRFRRYIHNDVASCERLLKNSTTGSLLVTDGVFSMDGDIAPLNQLAGLADQYNTLLMVDDAHGIGCMGDSGRGCLDVSGVSPAKVPILMGTFGKAIGTAGAFIATTNDIGEYLTQFARPYIYTTAMSPAMAQVTSVSIRLLQSSEGGELREKLAENIRYFRQKMQTYPLELMTSFTAIQPILVGESSVALKMSEQLRSRGVWCTAIRPPTVPIGLARLRITLSASHSLQDIDMLVDALEFCLPN